MVFVVGEYIEETPKGNLWIIVGVFDSENDAKKVCEGKPNYFVGPIEKNKAFHENVDWTGAYYPWHDENRVSTTS